VIVKVKKYDEFLTFSLKDDELKAVFLKLENRIIL
jgi:hypothetical protein